ncbi:MAG: chaperonin GroEL [Omnitrophica WOR_2 bacterium]
MPKNQKAAQKTVNRPGIVFQPKTYRKMQRGVHWLVNAIRPTLGPFPRVVAIAKSFQSGSPELLDSGGTIARRVIQLPDRDEDMGAMYLRHVLWKLQETAGDGTATAAVLFQAIYDRGLTYIASGGNAMHLRGYLEQGLKDILEVVDKQAQPVRGKKLLSQFAETVCHDPDLSKMLGEIFDIIGPYGRLDIRKSEGFKLEREYVEGMYWDKGLLARGMANDEHSLTAQLENTAIFISDLDIESPVDFVPLLEAAIEAGFQSLLVIARDISDRAVGILLTPQNREKIQAIAVKTPGSDLTSQLDSMEDLGILTGGKVFLRATQDTVQSVKPEDFGRARRIYADQKSCNVIGGKGDPRLLRQHIATLRAAYQNANESEERERLQKRIGRLLGGSATIWIGALTASEIEYKVNVAERTAEAIRRALRDGVVPGGGIALLSCQDVLKQKLRASTNSEQRAAYAILLEAVAEPFYTLLGNAGLQPGSVLAQIREAGPGFGIDLANQKIVCMQQTGIQDAVSVTRSAIRSAVSGAALALTTDVLVHRRNPPQAINGA